MRTEPTAEAKEAYEKARAAFEGGNIEAIDRKSLSAHLVAIANHATGDDAIQARDTIQAITLNHLILQRPVDELERRGTRMQIAVVWLTVAAVIGTFVQVWLAFR